MTGYSSVPVVSFCPLAPLFFPPEKEVAKHGMSVII